MNFLKISFAFIIFTVLDIAFISMNMDSFQKQFVEIQGTDSNPKISGAILAYILLFFGLYWFILREHRSAVDAAILGGVINGVYETTNYTFFKKWQVITVIKDTIWGAVLWGLTTWTTYHVFQK